MEGPPPRYRRRRRGNALGCTCDCNYARSLQGICKILQLCILGLAWILIAASPYWRPIFVIGGETWPFHVVMLISILVWLATLFMYVMFLSGYHLSLPNRNWPKFEFYFNIAMTVFVIVAAGVEAGNVWRWDMSRGTVLTGGSSYSSYYQYGLRPGMSFTQTLNFNSYCSTRPNECSDYFNLLAGNNTYYTNHLFAVVLLFFAVIAYLVSTFFAYRTLRRFNRDMYQPGKRLKPTLWMRFQYRVETATEKARNKMSKLVKRNNEDDDEGEADEIDMTVSEKKKDPDLEAGFSPEENSTSDGRYSRAKSHSSHHSSRSHRSRSENGRSSRSRSHRHDEEVKSSRSSSTGRSKRSSRHTQREDRSPHSDQPPSYTRQPSNDSPTTPVKVETVPVMQAAPREKKNSKNKKKNQEVKVDLAPVASVMI